MHFGMKFAVFEMMKSRAGLILPHQSGAYFVINVLGERFSSSVMSWRLPTLIKSHSGGWSTINTLLLQLYFGIVPCENEEAKQIVVYNCLTLLFLEWLKVTKRLSIANRLTVDSPLSQIEGLFTIAERVWACVRQTKAFNFNVFDKQNQFFFTRDYYPFPDLVSELIECEILYNKFADKSALS